ncbi:MAG: hypothetical protein IT385_04965 [Deltaproteobacteria bacterium]|nr:hypothetical protein [Deltaproteobacteria bacterium]
MLPNIARASRAVRVAIALACLTPACADDAATSDALDPIDEAFLAADGKADDFAIAEGSPEAAGVLRVANELAQAQLAGKSGVGLGATAAKNIAKRRPFTTLAALDAVPYVGKASFTKLVAYATAHGYVVTTAGGGERAARATRTGWSGYWWSMQNGELALGWSGNGRKAWSESDALRFDACLAQTTPSCTTLIAQMGADKGRKLSPLMKFDLYVRNRLAAQGGGLASAPATAFAHATKTELDIHYIGDDTAHRYWDSRGYAGKCIGWALSTMFHDEPTKDVELAGVVFTPADIKGILAAIYNGAQFFVPEDMALGQEYHDANDASPEAYADVLPHDLFRALAATIDRGTMLEADLDPGDGVWNYPIHAYDVAWDAPAGGVVAGTLVLHLADDEVASDGVFSTNPARPDLKARTLDFELDVPAGWAGDLAAATGGRWVGEAVDSHPDAVLMGLEDGWRQSIYDYSGTQMKTEVNFQLIKREKVGTRWVPIVDRLLGDYYAR